MAWCLSYGDEVAADLLHGRKRGRQDDFALLRQQQLPCAGRPVGQLSGLGPNAAALVQAGVGPDMDEFIERPEIAIPAGGQG